MKPIVRKLCVLALVAVLTSTVFYAATAQEGQSQPQPTAQFVYTGPDGPVRVAVFEQGVTFMLDKDGVLSVTGGGLNQRVGTAAGGVIILAGDDQFMVEAQNFVRLTRGGKPVLQVSINGATGPLANGLAAKKASPAEEAKKASVTNTTKPPAVKIEN